VEAKDNTQEETPPASTILLNIFGQPVQQKAGARSATVAWMMRALVCCLVMMARGQRCMGCYLRTCNGGLQTAISIYALVDNSCMTKCITRDSHKQHCAAPHS
jgi:hypothetical protein